MTTGQYIKQKLKLSKINNIKICRVDNFYPITYIIFYNTRFPNHPIVYQNINNFPFVSMIYKGNNNLNTPKLLPLFDLEDFNSVLTNRFFITVDLSYYNLINKKMYEEVKEEDFKCSCFFNLDEEVTIYDLKGMSDVSLFKRTKKTRSKVYGSESKVAKIIDLTVNKEEDWIQYDFLTEVSEKVYKPNTKFKEVDPKNNFQLVDNPSKTYTINLRFLNVFKYLETKPNFDKKRELTKLDIKDVLKVCNVLVFSSSPSFHWIGVNYNLSQLDGALYPTDIPPNYWKNNKEINDYLWVKDKHLSGVLNNIEFYFNIMAQMLNKKLKEINYIS